MKKTSDFILTSGKYAGCPLSEVPISYLVDVIRFEPVGSPLAILFRKLLEDKTSRTIETGMFIATKRIESIENYLSKRKLCAETEKIMFSSEKSARRRMREIQNEPGANHYRVPQKVYQCPFCEQWHLTSRLFNKTG